MADVFKLDGKWYEVIGTAKLSGGIQINAVPYNPLPEEKGSVVLVHSDGFASKHYVLNDPHGVDYNPDDFGWWGIEVEGEKVDTTLLAKAEFTVLYGGLY